MAFDWNSYLGRYPDLRAAGIHSRIGAWWHWIRYGRHEGRWGAPPTYATRSTLVCPSVHSLYLRATGTLVCWDDAGNDQVLQAFDPSVDYAHDVYLGPVFNDVRQSLWQGRMPFETCKRCMVLRCRTEHSSYHVDNRVIEIFQVEPSYKCTLDCPGCVPLAVRRLAPPQNLDRDVLVKILDDLVAASVEVRAFDFQGHGEPLLHPELWRLTRMCRDAYPDSYVTVTTNAHGKFRDRILKSGINEIVCAIDGMSQESFEPYRVQGRFDLAFRFMRDVAKASKQAGAAIKVIWKYVLFEHNSAPEQILEAQRMARQASVDEVVFVLTRNGPRSESIEQPADVPILAGGVPVSFRFHEAELTDLERRIDEAFESLASGEAGRAWELAASIARNLIRFFPGRRELPPEHQTLMARLADLMEQLPDGARRSIEAELEEWTDRHGPLA